MLILNLNSDETHIYVENEVTSASLPSYSVAKSLSLQRIVYSDYWESRTESGSEEKCESDIRLCIGKG